ncbi:glycine-rich protein 2-like [Helianthus annuus]|uniref:glycine-rich protein 2-like n=1 Tax=Helianthus annuus TaxID=4232 RepID=UPI000B8F0257|nr:glycine-rich protein 2-like [Helianthus annuus]
MRGCHESKDTIRRKTELIHYRRKEIPIDIVEKVRRKTGSGGDGGYGGEGYVVLEGGCRSKDYGGRDTVFEGGGCGGGWVIDEGYGVGGGFYNGWNGGDVGYGGGGWVAVDLGATVVEGG